ncbi:MAG: hypothetical protein NVSMB25_03120 [Thermoleophilaceae bacterium]
MPPGGPPPTAEELRARVERHSWYHTLELGPDLVTRGMFDHRPVLARYPLPESLAGLRCLDVGTMDGFWAFELERRGAREVVAIDLDDPEALDWPAAARAGPREFDELKAERRAIAHEALGSAVRWVALSVYDLSPQLGLFDFVFCGDLLVHLKDPITAVERIRSVCTGDAVICTPIMPSRPWQRRPIAELDGIDGFTWWTPNMIGLVRLARAAGFARVEPARAFALPPADGGPWRGLRGAVRCSV